jgi:hypothetical protein
MIFFYYQKTDSFKIVVTALYISVGKIRKQKVSIGTVSTASSTPVGYITNK